MVDLFVNIQENDNAETVAAATRAIQDALNTVVISGSGNKVILSDKTMLLCQPAHDNNTGFDFKVLIESTFTVVQGQNNITVLDTSIQLTDAHKAIFKVYKLSDDLKTFKEYSTAIIQVEDDTEVQITVQDVGVYRLIGGE